MGGRLVRSEESLGKLNRQLLVHAILAGVLMASATRNVTADDQPDIVWVSDQLLFSPMEDHWQSRSDGLLQPASMLPTGVTYDAVQTFFQPQATLTPQQATPTPLSLPPAAQTLSTSLFGRFGVPSSLVASSGYASGLSTDVVFNPESQVRVSTDIGNLLFKSPSVISVDTQHRNPIITDPRVRGSRVGALAASGSHWVPARIDLDTMLSKIDSRIVEETVVIKGPYSALYGPGFQFIDVTLQPAPRYGQKFENHGSTGLDYKTNGENWYGRQSIWGGQSDWGYRVSYGHRTGNDYDSGNGIQIPSSFKSRDVEVALGADLTRQSNVDFHYLRLDQTDLELPGQAFDIDFLVTDGYEVIYRSQEQRYFDQIEFRSWYNRTRFDGSAQRPGKRDQFPIFDSRGLTLFTDVDSMSAGYRAMGSWEDCNGSRFTTGADLRYVKQELNEFANGFNSPIPRSHSSNPGLFLEASTPTGNPFIVRAGGRVDWVLMNIDDEESELAEVTPDDIPYAALVGSDQFDQEDTFASAYIAADYRLDRCSNVGLSFGFAQRPPNLTERYAAEPFMFLLQNGLNTVTGDPTLKPEKLWQLDLSYHYYTPRLRSGVTGFFAWAHDYITFENLSIERFPPSGNPGQTNLKYVNTSFATFAGVEWYGEFDASRRITPFATMKYVQGTDHTRRGDFDTIPADRVNNIVIASTRDFDRPRGFDSGVAGANSEPLPGILPLEARIGVRIHPLRRRRRSQNLRPQRYGGAVRDGRLAPIGEPLKETGDEVYAASWQSDVPDAPRSGSTGFEPSRNYRSRSANRNQRRHSLTDDMQQQDRWGIELSARIVDNQSRVAVSLLETPTPGFTVWDLRTFWRPRSNSLVVLGVENFIDKNYREHLDFRSLDADSFITLQPGVNFYIGSEFTY